MSTSAGKEDAKHRATHELEAHGKTIDALHKKLEALHDADDVKGKEKLRHAVEKYKAAHGAFVDDVLWSLPTR